MRKIIVLAFISLDGVMQAPGSPEEDTSGGFEYGGWTAHYSDEVSRKVIQKEMAPADLLLGRKTFELFANYWPKHEEQWPGINDVTKYVLSNTIKKSDWKNTVFITNVAEIEKLKNSEGGDIKIWGSSKLVQLLLKHNLVDELWLKTFPVVLGKGKRLFNDEATATALELIGSHVTPSGLILTNYKRAGKVKTGTIGA